jgi:hypothetical protein
VLAKVAFNGLALGAAADAPAAAFCGDPPLGGAGGLVLTSAPSFLAFSTHAGSLTAHSIFFFSCSAFSRTFFSGSHWSAPTLVPRHATTSASDTGSADVSSIFRIEHLGSVPVRARLSERR